MKSLYRKLFTFGFIAALPFLAGVSLTWRFMWHSVGLREGEACVRSFHAVSKGIYWEGSEWHHYVVFHVDVTEAENHRWRIVNAPMPSSIWKENSQEATVRVMYRWPSDWQDPFPLERWELCRLDS